MQVFQNKPMTYFIEIEATQKSLSLRKPIYGVGINNSWYMTEQKIKGKRVFCPYYVKWKSMIQRCYSEKYHDKKPNYKDCSVCTDWLIFSKFKEWMVTQRWQDKHLDKDIINYGNKIYSPENCCFVHGDINMLLTDSNASRGMFPQGVSYNKSRDKFNVEMRKYGEVVYLGRYTTSKEAEQVYIEAKSKHILEIASVLSDQRVVKGLIIHANKLMERNHGTQ